MKRTNINIGQLRRNKYTSAEEKFEWLNSALEFGKMKKNAEKILENNQGQ